MNTLVVASDPKELAAGQHRMIEDVAHKIELAKIEATEAKAMAQTMIGARLGANQAKAMHRRATSRVAWLVKVKGALEAGYCMMPDMDAVVIAVRTDRVTPSPAALKGRTWAGQVPDEKAKGLPAGQGAYISPRQKVSKYTASVPDGKGGYKDVERFCAYELKDPDGLDRRFVRPEIMTRTANAMALKLFDEIATVTPTNTRTRSSKPDPIVLGRIIDPRTGKSAAFLIAWFMDTAEI